MKSAKELRAQARKALQGRYWPAFLASLIASVLGGTAISSGYTAAGGSSASAANSAAQAQLSPEEAAVVIGVFLTTLLLVLAVSIVYTLIGGAVELGYNAFNLKLYETGEKPSLKLLFSRFSIFGKALWLRILIGIKVFLWTLLFIVPGLIAALRYAMAPYLMAAHPELGASEAIEKSKALMVGNKWRLCCLGLSFFGWYLLAALTAGIGFFFLAPYVKAAETAFYLALTQQPAAQA